MSTPHKHLSVIVRFDEPVAPAGWKQSVKVLKVFSDRHFAEREAERLRFVNGPDKCIYEVHAAHSALES